MATIHGSQFNDNDTVNGDPSIFRPNLVGTPFSDTIYGYEGDDVLDGGDGYNYLYGGAGNDTYIFKVGVLNFVTEYANEGDDTIMSGTNFFLWDNLENLVLLDEAEIGGGNDANNYMIGNDVNNTLYGWGGSDRMDGGRGIDTLYGDNGDDTLTGDSADTLYGGAGNDSFIISSTDVKVIEYAAGQYAGGGRDRVDAMVSYTLTANVEDLVLFSDDAINGTGNGMNNQMTGGNGDNRISGLGGNDTLDGGDGKDNLNGGNGADTLVGGGSADTLTGGGGADKFMLDFYPMALYSPDLIQDFKSTEADKVVISGASGWAKQAHFTYDQSTGILAYDHPSDEFLKMTVAKFQPNTAFNVGTNLVFA
jgi:Ca2+-binding RTX toxin-like protein